MAMIFESSLSYIIPHLTRIALSRVMPAHHSSGTSVELT